MFAFTRTCPGLIYMCWNARRTVTKPPLPYPGEDAKREAVRISALPAYESQTWLLLEYCDRPCLQVGQPHTSQSACCISHTKGSCKMVDLLQGVLQVNFIAFLYAAIHPAHPVTTTILWGTARE